MIRIKKNLSDEKDFKEKAPLNLNSKSTKKNVRKN